MAIADNDGALICRKDRFQIRSRFELLEVSTMGQFTGSTGYFTVTAVSLSDQRCIFEIDKVGLCYIMSVCHRNGLFVGLFHVFNLNPIKWQKIM